MKHAEYFGRLIAVLCFAMSASAQVAGLWDFSVTTPRGNDEARVELHGNDGVVSGFYSGTLGARKPIQGTYRDNTLFMVFKGEWPDTTEVEVKLTGTLSGDSGSGTAVVVDRTEGSWTARRVKQDEPKTPAPIPEKANATGRVSPDKFAGEWQLKAGAEQLVEDAVHRATESMSSFTRGVARGRLMKSHAPPRRIRMERRDAFFAIEFDAAPALMLPISGADVQREERTVRLQVEDGALRQIFETREGNRENVYRIGNKPDLMTMDVTVTSPRLPNPLRYALEFTRTQPSAAAATLLQNR